MNQVVGRLYDLKKSEIFVLNRIAGKHLRSDTIWKSEMLMWIGPNCRKIPTIWKICIEQIVGKILRFERWGLNQIVERFNDSKRVKCFMWIGPVIDKFLQFERCGLN